MCYSTKCDCVHVWLNVLSTQFMCLAFTYVERCMEGLRTLWRFFAAVCLDKDADLPKLWHCPFTFLPKWDRATHEDFFLFFLLVEERVCVYVCALHPSAHNHSEGSRNSSRHITPQFPACHSMLLTFSTRSVYFSKRGCRGPEESGSVARLQRGEEWKDGVRKRTGRVGVRVPLSDPAHAL